MGEEEEGRELPLLSPPTPPPRCFFFFPAHISLRSPHDLNAWNRLRMNFNKSKLVHRKNTELKSCVKKAYAHSLIFVSSLCVLQVVKEYRYHCVTTHTQKYW